MPTKTQNYLETPFKWMSSGNMETKLTPRLENWFHRNSLSPTLAKILETKPLKFWCLALIHVVNRTQAFDYGGAKRTITWLRDILRGTWSRWSLVLKTVATYLLDVMLVVIASRQTCTTSDISNLPAYQKFPAEAKYYVMGIKLIIFRRLEVRLEKRDEVARQVLITNLGSESYKFQHII